MAKVGRPTDYHPGMATALRLAADAGTLGAATANEIAKELGIHASTVYDWMKHEDFAEAFTYARTRADREIESALFKKARGFDFTETTKTTKEGGKRAEKEGAPMTEVTESVKQVYVPPDTAAAVFWLKNRQRKDWTDKTEVEVTGNFADQVEAYLASKQVRE